MVARALTDTGDTSEVGFSPAADGIDGLANKPFMAPRVFAGRDARLAEESFGPGVAEVLAGLGVRGEGPTVADNEARDDRLFRDARGASFGVGFGRGVVEEPIREMRFGGVPGILAKGGW